MDNITMFTDNGGSGGSIDETLLGILLSVDSLSIPEQTLLARELGFRFETQFFQVYLLRPIAQVTHESAGGFIDALEVFKHGFMKLLSGYGSASSTHFRGEIYFVMNLDRTHAPRTAKDNRVLSNRISQETMALLSETMDGVCPCLVVSSTIRHGINSLYLGATEAIGQAESFQNRAKRSANSLVVPCDSKEKDTQSYVAGYQLNKRIINMALTLNFSSLSTIIAQNIHQNANRPTPAYRTRLDESKTQVTRRLHQVMNVIGDDILLIGPSSYLLNSYLEIPLADSFEELEKRTEYFLSMLSEQARILEDSMGRKNEIADYILKNYMNPNLNIASLADTFSISREHLSRIFKTVTGVNISKYLESTRITAAKQLLSAGLPIAETALKCGYYDRRSFSTAFKRVEGVTPGAWLKQL